MSNKQEIAVKVLQSPINEPYDNQYQHCHLELSATVDGKEYRIPATWDRVTGLNLSALTQFQYLIDGKQRAVLAARKEYLESRLNAAFDLNVWDSSMKTAIVHYDPDFGKTV